MILGKISAAFIAAIVGSLGLGAPTVVHATPPAPVLVAPADGASLVQPITLDWNPVVDPNGPIGSYTWQVAKSATFSTVLLEGFTSMLFEGVGAATSDMVSGLPNGIYFWRVKATSISGGDSPWSSVRSFTVTGLGPAPRGKPTFSTPTNNARFHAGETFTLKWSAISGAHYYLLEVDDEPTFSYPLAFTTNALTFGTQAGAGWGNEIPNLYYRVRAVSADNVRGLPSKTLIVHVTNNAPVPSAPSQVAPGVAAALPLPITFDWTDTANPQVAGYDLDIDTDPNFGGNFGVLLIQNITRSDYMVASDLPPGEYFWRIRALHGSVAGPWSAGRAITVTEAAPTPVGLVPFWLVASPTATSGGNPTQARLTLNAPAPAGGAVVSVASDLPQANLPATVFIPEGKTDAVVTPITTEPVSGATISTLRAAYGGGVQQSSIGLYPLLLGTQLGAENVVGGESFNGTLTLLDPAPPGGLVVRLVSGNTSLFRPPPTVTIPEGELGATFSIATSPVTESILVALDSGTESDGFLAPRLFVILTPPGGATLPPSLTSITFAQSSILGGTTTTGTVTLTGPAPAGGALIPLSGSLEGTVVVPPSVTVPAGSMSANFTISVPPVLEPHWVIIQSQYGTFNGNQAKLLEVNPGAPGPPTVFALGVSDSTVIAGDTIRGTAGIFAPAPGGGAAVRLTSTDPSIVQVPAKVRIAQGNSANSFKITTGSVPIETSVRVDATLGGITKSVFVNVSPNPNDPPLLEDLTVTPSSVRGGTNATGTVTLSTPAPPGGIFVTLSTDNTSVAQVPPIVAVPGGQTAANFTVTTFPVSNNTVVAITAFYGSGSQSADLTVTR